MAAVAVQTSVHGVGLCEIEEELLRNDDRHRGGAGDGHGTPRGVASARRGHGDGHGMWSHLGMAGRSLEI
jgi:hypothetical protein